MQQILKPAIHGRGPRRAAAASVRALGFAAALLGPAALAAGPATGRLAVDVVIAEDSPAHDELLAATRTALAAMPERRVQLRVRTATQGRQAAVPGDPPAQLLVTVGVSAAEAVLRDRPAIPVYCTFLPRAAYELLVERYLGSRDSRGVSALYVDQPVQRRLRLLRTALPQTGAVGVVLGPTSRRRIDALQQAASAAGFRLRTERIDDEQQLVGAVYRALDDTDALLAMPDPLVFNRQTAQGVLLTAYRKGKPVVGYSQAYVRAGALLAVFSTPGQIGRQLGETAAALAESPTPNQLPPPQYPRYFSVDINARVARSLGLDLAPAEELARQLADAEKGSP